MRLWYLSIFILCVSFRYSFAQTKDTTENVNKVFVAVEVPPQFPGGNQRFFEYLARNVRYPLEARRNNIQGKVFISFVVKRDGKLADPMIVRSLSPETDAEAIRLINLSPHWTPGIQNGRAVDVAYTIAVTFRMAGSTIVKDTSQTHQAN